MNRSLCGVARHEAGVGTCVACGLILSQSRFNFNSIARERATACDNGVEEEERDLDER
jgi:hypothetical protein